MKVFDTSTTAGKAEVMLASANGESVQISGQKSGGWVDAAFPRWDWATFTYRIKRLEFPAPPEGEEWHNSENLTPEQVGILEGYRLAIKSEVLTGSRFCGFYVWTISKDWAGEICPNIGKFTYRTKHPLPTKSKFVPLEAGDVPPVCWIRQKNGASLLVIEVHFGGVLAGNIWTGWKELQKREYSTDRKTWLPCSKVAELEGGK